MEKSVVGVLGGLGPQATIYFMNLVVKNTEVNRDQEHIDMIVFNHASIPDRTAFILGKSDENPTPFLIEDCHKLYNLGCDFIVMPCNTAHFVYSEIAKNSKLPIINIIEETVNKCVNANKVGIMATDGTLSSGVYQSELKKNNIEYFIPDANNQSMIMKIIYDYVKVGKPVNINDFDFLIDYFIKNGCDKVIIGCTELSIIVDDYNRRGNNIVDSLYVLANKTIELAGAKKKER